jgi:hypothetical protein
MNEDWFLVAVVGLSVPVMGFLTLWAIGAIQ